MSDGRVPPSPYAPASKEPNPGDVAQWNNTEENILDKLDYWLRDELDSFNQMLFRNSDQPGVRMEWDGDGISSVIYPETVYTDQGKRLIGVRCVRLVGNRWHLSFGSVLAEEDENGYLEPVREHYENWVYMSRVGFICHGFKGLTTALSRELKKHRYKIPDHPHGDRSRITDSRQLQSQISPEYLRLSASDPSGLYRSVDTPQVIRKVEDINPRETKKIVDYLKGLGLELRQKPGMSPAMFDSHRLISHHGEKSKVFTKELATGDRIVVLVCKDDDDNWYVNFRAVPPRQSFGPVEQCGYKCDEMVGLFRVFSGPMREFVGICIEKSNQIAQARKKPGR